MTGLIAYAARGVGLGLLILVHGAHLAAAQDPNRPPVVLTFWTADVERDRIAAIRYLMDGFTAGTDGIEVEIRGIDEAEFPEAFMGAADAGKAPDIVHASADTVIALGAGGALDLDRTTKLVADIGERRFAGGAKRALRGADGRYFGVPFHGWLQGVIYRTDWFAEAGLEPPNSWDRLAAAAERLHDPANGRYGVLIGTQADFYAQQIFTHLALTNGVRIVDAQGRLVFNSPRTVETLELIKRLAQFGPPGPQGTRGRDYYLQGRLAMMFYSSYIMDDIAIEDAALDALTPENFADLEGNRFDPTLIHNTRSVPILWNLRSTGFGSIIALGLGKTEDPNRQAAQHALVRFLFRRDAHIAWLHIEPGGNLPVMPEIAAEPMFYRDLRGVFARFGRDRVAAIVNGMNEIDSFGVIDGTLRPEPALVLEAGIIGEMIRRAVWDDVPPAEAVAWAEKEMQTLLQRAAVQ